MSRHSLVPVQRSACRYLRGQLGDVLLGPAHVHGQTSSKPLGTAVLTLESVCAAAGGCSPACWLSLWLTSQAFTGYASCPAVPFVKPGHELY